MENNLNDKLIDNLLEWINLKMDQSGGEKAIIGISGGKDSSITAGLMVKAIGK